MTDLIIIYAALIPLHFIVFYLHDKDLVWFRNFTEETDRYKVSWKNIILKSIGFPVFWTWFVIKMIVGIAKDYIDMKKVFKEMDEAETIEELIELTDKAFEIIDR